MIEYVTEAELRRFSSQLGSNKQASLRATASSISLAGATFLSHSSKDEELVVGAIRILDEHGARVYIDEIDPEMPPYTNVDTASKLKERIQQTSRFVLLASANSKDSRWVPWELGIADSSKGMDRIALFPAVEKVSEMAWVKWEYLGLYRRIVWGDLQGHEAKVWMVLDHKKNTATELRTWLSQ